MRKSFHIKNLYSPVLEENSKEVFDTIFSKKSIRAERIFSNGKSSPAGFWYDQEEDEWVVLLKGFASLEFENDQTLEMGEGDYLMIPAHTRHRVKSTSTDPVCVWLAVFIS